jgi:hypothetical protein
MRLMRRVIDLKMQLEIGPSSQEIRRRKDTRRRRGITGAFNEIEVATKKSRNVIRQRRQKINKRTIESNIIGFKINIKQLKRRMRRTNSRVTAKLDIATNKGRERHIRTNIIFQQSRRINNNSTSLEKEKAKLSSEARCVS